jgi:acylphosphatase
MKTAARFIIKGTVQGVFFRRFVKENADKLGLVGYVRNLTSGDVEVFAEGEMDKIDRLFQIVKKGPEHAQIRNIQIEERKYSDQFKDFQILKF